MYDDFPFACEAVSQPMTQMIAYSDLCQASVSVAIGTSIAPVGWVEGLAFAPGLDEQ